MVNIFDTTETLQPSIISNVQSIPGLVTQHYNKKLDDLDIVFGSDEWLLKINIDYLNHDYYTDIITFNYNEDSSIAGEICISLDRVYENAKKYSVSRETELYRVVIHGVLHLCGLDDQSELDQKKMRDAEDFFLINLELSN